MAFVSCPELSQADFEAAAEERLRPIAPELDLESFQAVWLLNQAADAARRHLEEHALLESDLSWSQFDVMWHLWLFGEQESRCVAQALRISKSGMTVIATQLVGRALVKRQVSPADRRRVYLSVTKKGEAFMKRLFPRFNRAEGTFTDALSSQQKKELAGLLHLLLGTNP
ncbi:hypothetical protein Lesp02_14730 [Lentzea sp. NBRC 105346]|uniref:MarR family winged helix-turn-helix transcriptional regulator n=1 Tax=Lentzea sp. NBRC 105346 TaxID=3032205 RepID=UPI0024A31670|nr:MarR family transcriptional regulator [Lentzea sp. NBRC 105346]GLZ29283.1 hypothetical protein Lesp02_14730 [Lentzea sp. NBRC 105346]